MKLRKKTFEPVAFSDETKLQLKQMEDLYQAAQKVARLSPATAEAAHARAEFDATLALIQVRSAERIGQASLDTSRTLTKATVALAVATVVLAIATVVLVFVTANLSS